MADPGTVDRIFIAVLPATILNVAGATVRAWTFLAGLPFLRGSIKTGSLFVIAVAFALTLTNQATRFDHERTPGIFIILLSFGGEAILGWLLSLPFALALHRLPMFLRMADLVRGAQEAEQAIAGLEGRTSLLERVGWIAVAVAMHSSGFLLPILSNWFSSFDRFPPLFLITDKDIYPDLLGQLDFYFSRLSMLALETVLTAIVTAFPLFVAGLIIDLVRISAARMINAQMLATEWQGVKLVAILLLAGLLINSRLSESIFHTIQSAAAAAELLLARR